MLQNNWLESHNDSRVLITKLVFSHPQFFIILLSEYSTEMLFWYATFCPNTKLFIYPHTVTVYLLIMLCSLQEPATRELLSANFLQTDDQPTSEAQGYHKDNVLHFVLYPNMQLIGFLSHCLKQKSNPM